MDTEYQHDWLRLMPPKALALTSVSIFHNWRITKEALGSDYPSEAEDLDAMQEAFDELCELAGAVEAYEMIFHAPGMDQDLFDQFMETVE